MAAIILSDEQAAVLKAAEGGASMFITGKAGTGKSMLIEFIIKQAVAEHGEDHVFATASTGISACHIGGITIHSFAGIGCGEDDVSSIVFRMFPPIRARWRATKVLIIDEISMISPEIFDKLEAIARRIRRSMEPFGGIQVIACGDFYQLPPVYKGAAEIKYCFESKAWKNTISGRIHELKNVLRQRDTRFLDVLDGVRDGYLSAEKSAILQRRVGVTLPTTADSPYPTKLRSRRDTALKENIAQLNLLTGEGKKSTAIDAADTRGYLDQLKSGCPAPEVLLLRVGARVLLIRNLDVSMGLCNGTAGKVIRFDNGVPVVEFASATPPITLPIEKVKWELKVGKDVVATRLQFPLILGWSVTIHKSQGMTLDSADIELSQLFADGQGYTALSRVRSLEGLAIDELPKPGTIVTNEKVKAFYQQFTS